MNLTQKITAAVAVLGILGTLLGGVAWVAEQREDLNARVSHLEKSLMHAQGVLIDLVRAIMIDHYKRKLRRREAEPHRMAI